jgi:hypothetical protein
MYIVKKQRGEADMFIEEWLQENVEARMDYFNKLKGLEKEFFKLERTKEVLEYKAYDRTGYHTRTKEFYVKFFEGKKIVYIFQDKGFEEFLNIKYIQITKQDTEMLKYQIDEIRIKLQKEAVKSFKELTKNIEKILGSEVIKIYEYSQGDNTIMVLEAENGKKVRVTKFIAGGYNIQCLHIRVKIKEIA